MFPDRPAVDGDPAPSEDHTTMLATLAALHLLVFAQVEPPASEPTPPPDADAQAAPEATAPQEPLPPAPQPAPERARVARTPAPPAQKQLSLLSAEPLGGGSMTMAWAGWSSLGAAWGQGITNTDDLGLQLEFDWAGTELLAGAWYRRPLGTAGVFDMAGRLGLAWYADFGGHFIHEGNHDARGVQLQPSLVFSVRGGGGIFSTAGELPITVTTTGDGGVLFAPRLAMSYEVPVYPELNVGVLGSVGYRVGADDAPMRDGRVDVRFLLVAGYQIL